MKAIELKQNETAGAESSEKFYSRTVRRTLLSLGIGFEDLLINIVFNYYLSLPLLQNVLTLLDETDKLRQRVSKKPTSDENQRVDDKKIVGWLEHGLYDILIEFRKFIRTDEPATYSWIPSLQNTVNYLFLSSTHKYYFDYPTYNHLDMVAYFLIHARTTERVSQETYNLILEVKNIMLAWISLVELKPYFIDFSLAKLIMGDSCMDHSASDDVRERQMKQRARLNGTLHESKNSNPFSKSPIYATLAMEGKIENPRLLCIDLSKDGFEALLSDLQSSIFSQQPSIPSTVTQEIIFNKSRA